LLRISDGRPYGARSCFGTLDRGLFNHGRGE
jgi:hypothetical protein